MTLSHYDARGHLIVARRIIDSITPGWQQIGAVWLPLPHLLNMLPVQIDVLYRTGASGIALFLLVVDYAYLSKKTGVATDDGIHTAEQRLKNGALQALVATASLELGIDIGEIDLVCQLGSPHAIASFLQRVGRWIVSGSKLATYWAERDRPSILKGRPPFSARRGAPHASWCSRGAGGSG